MSKRKWKIRLSLALAAVLAAGNMAYAVPLAVQAENNVKTERTADDASGDPSEGGTTWYIDAAGGNDRSNDGMSPEKAWKTFKKVKSLRLKAGDKVLLKAGCTWNGEKLMLIGAKGTEKNPVILGRYGEGADPVINGQGSTWLDVEDRSSLKKEDVAAVHIQNSSYITVQNLEVTNWETDSSDLMGETKKKNVDKNNNQTDRPILYDQSKYMLTGILVENHDAGDLAGVVIKDNYVHDVNGYMSQNGSEGHKKGSGGIMALVTGGKTKSYYTDLKIIGNKVEKVCHEAIYMESCWAARKLVGGAGSQQAGSLEWVGWPNVYVADNYVNDVAGDGIVLINADGGLAEHNLVTKSASEDWYYGRNPAHAAIWMWDCNNVTMQYNEAGYTESTQDGMAFDCDYGNQNVMYQYNYSHDNKGGFWMACPGPYYTVNAVVRYNVSVNDGLYDGSRIIHVGEDGSIGNQVYNNTMYWNAGYEVNAVEQGSWISSGQKGESSGTDIYNNIFSGDSAHFANHDGIRYDSNCVWGSSKESYPMEEDTRAVAADPEFMDVKAYTAGTYGMTAEGGKVTLGSPSGFKLQGYSPCIKKGKEYMPVPQDTFDAVKDETDPVTTHITLEYKDYEGNTVPQTSEEGKSSVDIGAFQYQGEPTVKVPERPEIEKVLALVPEEEEAAYTKTSWKAYQDAVKEAEDTRKNGSISAEEITRIASNVQKAFDGLTLRGNTYALKTLYDICAAKKKGDYEAAGWPAFKTALNNAKSVLDNEDALQPEVDKARTDLVKARNALKRILKEQKIQCRTSYKKVYGNKAFKLNAKRTVGNGKLSYKTSDKKVADVKNGTVTIKGTGSCVITVTAAKTDTYKAKSVKISLQVSPKKAVLKSIKVLSGRKAKVTWNKAAKITGYEVRYSTDKKFKSGVKKVLVPSSKANSTTIKGLKKGKKYYVQVRAYKAVNKKTKLYGAWSTAKISKKVK